MVACMTHFLHLFAAHRAALAQAQRAEDMLIYERDRADKAEAALVAAQRDAIARERQLLDRLTSRPPSEPHIATPEERAEQLRMTGTPMSKALAEQKRKTFEALTQMANRIKAEEEAERRRGVQ